MENLESENNPETPKNPNSISELLSVSKDIETSSGRVYRSVGTWEAIQDLLTSRVVRNKQQAGLTERSRWGDTVFWSRGEAGKFHCIGQGSYVIEAPLSVAEERTVCLEDVSAIFMKDENGQVKNILADLL